MPPDWPDTFDRRRQRLRLILTSGGRLLLTLLFIAVFVAALRSCKSYLLISLWITSFTQTIDGYNIRVAILRERVVVHGD